MSWPCGGVSVNKAFSLLEVLVTMSIGAILLALAFGTYQQVQGGSARAVCLNNLRQWGVALAMYTQDNDGRIPRRGQGVRPVEILDRPDDWFNALPPYLQMASYLELSQQNRAPRPGQKSIFVCPLAKDLGKPNFLAYGMNMYLSPWNRPDMHRMQEIPRPGQLAFLADGPGGWSSAVPSSLDYSVLARHGDSANVIFVDGHGQSFSGDYLGCGRGNATKPDVRWETETDGVNQTHIP